MGTTTKPVAGWYRDPSHRHEHRWWNGTAWTPHVMSVGMRSLDYGESPAVPESDASDETPPARATESPVAPVAPVALVAPRWPVAVWCFVMLGVGLMVVGALLPWAEASSSNASFSRSGIDGNGSATLCIAIGIALLCALGPRTQASALLVGGAAVVAGAVGVHDARDFSDMASALVRSMPSVSAGVGIGVWVTLAGAVSALAGGVVAFAVSRRT